MPRLTIHIGAGERLKPAISKATPLGALGTEALVWLGTTCLSGPAAALRALADALVEAAEMADDYDADPDGSTSASGSSSTSTGDLTELTAAGPCTRRPLRARGGVRSGSLPPLTSGYQDHPNHRGPPAHVLPDRAGAKLIVMLGTITWALDWARNWQQQRRRVRVLVHQGVFLPPTIRLTPGPPVTGSAEPYVAPIDTSDPSAASAVPEALFSGPLYYFVKVTNLGVREVVITHVWVDGNPPVAVLVPQRPLPARLRPDEQWEVPIPAEAVQHIPEPEWQVRVRLSSGQTVKSRLNRDVPPVGFMAGPGSGG
jgi:hypothetical protein